MVPLAPHKAYQAAVVTTYLLMFRGRIDPSYTTSVIRGTFMVRL